MTDEEIISALLERLQSALSQVDRALTINDTEDEEAIREVENTTRYLEAFGLSDREIMDRVQALNKQ